MSSYLFIVSLLKLLLYYKMMKGDWRQKSYTKRLVSASSILAHLQQLTRQLTAASVTKIVIATISRKCVTFTFYGSDKKSFIEAKGVLVQKPLSLNNRVSYLFLPVFSTNEWQISQLDLDSTVRHPSGTEK